MFNLVTLIPQRCCAVGYTYFFILAAMLKSSPSGASFLPCTPPWFKADTNSGFLMSGKRASRIEIAVTP